MNSNEVEYYQSGYDDCRNLLIGDLQLSMKKRIGFRAEIQNLIEKLLKEQDEDHWRKIQLERINPELLALSMKISSMPISKSSKKLFTQQMVD